MRLVPPVLVIGPEHFDKIQDFYQLIIINNKNIRGVVETLFLSHPRRVLLADAAKLSGASASVLLKFVEEYRGQVAIHSSADVMDVVMLSRFKTVLKGGTDPKLDDDETVVLLRNPELLAVKYACLAPSIKTRILGRV